MKWLVLVVAACGSGPPAPVHPAAGSGTPPPLTASSPSERECDDLFAHVAAVVAAERNAARPEQQTVDEDQGDERGTEHAQHMAECRAMPRDTYTCAIAARTSDAVAACDQATRSSSTSNSSVAPGGMTPAAPRSP